MSDETKVRPMYVEDFEHKNTSPHPFWARRLVAPCHPESAVDIEYQGASDRPPAGLIEVKCFECKRVIGKIVVANDPKAKYTKSSTN